MQTGCNMGQWVVTVAGIAILSVLCDVILPEGQTRKYVKTVFGVVVTLVIVQPLIRIFDGNFDFSLSLSDGDSVGVQEQYIESVDTRQNENKIRLLKMMLEANNILVEDIAVSELDERVTLQLSTRYNQQYETKINEVVSSSFPGYETVIIWM